MPFIDLHIHSEHSDGENSITNILKQLKKLKIGAAITDHNEIKGAMRATNQKDILIIPGIEVGTIENRHTNLLFYNAKELAEFYNKEIKMYKRKDAFFDWQSTNLKIVDLLDRAEKYNCVIVANHPFNRILKNKNWYEEKIPNIKNIDAVEVLNSVITKNSNKVAEKLAEKLNKSKVAGSDAHKLENIGKAGITTEEQDVEGILNAIKKGNIKVEGKSYNPKEILVHYYTVAKNNTFPVLYDTDELLEHFK